MGVLAMAPGAVSFGSMPSALCGRKSVGWQGFQQECSLPCTIPASSLVASNGSFRTAGKSLTVCSRSDLSSQFWGEDHGFNRRPTLIERKRSASMPLVEARLFGPSIFNAAKLRVLLLGKPDSGEEQPLQHPRIYTLTHSDVTAQITLAVAREINKAQVMGWYSKLQRDEVVAEWRKTQGEVSLHVHCHISGTNFLHRLIAKLRFYIFRKELPLVLEAFVHGDRELFEQHPELLDAPVWVYFHSNVEEYNRAECWGPLVDATQRGQHTEAMEANNNLLKSVAEIEQQFPSAAVCLVPCDCCSRHAAVIPIPESLNRLLLKSQDVSLQFRITTKDDPS